MLLVSHRRTRRGAVVTGWLALWGLLLIVLLWAVELLSFRSHGRVELQIADDAAAHAAARDLVTESVFTVGYTSDAFSSSVVPIDRAALIAKARADGERYGQLSRVMGHGLTIHDNATNNPHGELFIDSLENPTSRDFLGLRAVGTDPYNPDLNAVRVKTHWAKISASSTYYVDRDVVGFRLKQPPSSNPTFPTLPMVPIAILSQPCVPGPTTNVPACWTSSSKSLASWEKAIMGRQGPDKYLMGPGGLPITAVSNGGVGDNIPEISVTLTEGGNTNDNGQLVYFNPAEAFAALVGQVTGGVAFGDLLTPGQQPGQFVLNDGTQAQNVAAAPTGSLPPASNSLSAGGATTLAGSATTTKQTGSGLLGILGQPRVWLLYSGVANQNGNPVVDVVGFVVARVMNVQVAGAGGSGNSLTITLQPSVLVTDKALTNWALRDLGPRSLYNPYVARLRFVE